MNMSDVSNLMKRCQRGVGGRNALDEAHGIMAECYGTLGRMQSEIERLRQFANEIISGILAGESFDGGDIQEMAVQHGLLRPELRTQSCGDTCVCSEFGFPSECFRKTALLLGAASAEGGE